MTMTAVCECGLDLTTAEVDVVREHLIASAHILELTDQEGRAYHVRAPAVQP